MKKHNILVNFSIFSMAFIKDYLQTFFEMVVFLNRKKKNSICYNLIFRSGNFTARKIPNSKKIPAIVKYSQSNPVSGPNLKKVIINY